MGLGRVELPTSCLSGEPNKEKARRTQRGPFSGRTRGSESLCTRTAEWSRDLPSIRIAPRRASALHFRSVQRQLHALAFLPTSQPTEKALSLTEREQRTP